MLNWIVNLFGPSSPPPIVLADQTEQLSQERSTFQVASETFDGAKLLRNYPPKIDHPKKRLLFDFALASHPNASVTVDRYREIPLPERFLPYSPSTTVKAVKGFFRYRDSDASHCYMNFAHHDLFNGYGHFMFAQDEIQVAEHPLLASLRELMLTREDDLRPRTVENGAPTPVVFRAIPRTISIDTRQIYGARLTRADDELIRESVSRVDPPVCSSILAIEAPISSGNNIYTRSEVESALKTAYSGFRAFILSSDALWTTPFVLHTGNWGCGAYGGNRQLMISIQIIAASLAGISEIVFYCGTDSTDRIADFEAQLHRRFQFRPGTKVSKVVDRLVTAAFPWGTPDGN